MVKYKCIHKGVQLKYKSNTLETDWLQHDRLTPCVIIQQHYSTTVILLCFHSEEKPDVC
jgi:hypothetical protein